MRELALMGGAFVGGAAMGGLPQLSKLAWVGGEGGEDHPLLVVGATQHLQEIVGSVFTQPSCISTWLS